MRIWNARPGKVVEAGKLITCKNSLVEHLKHHHIQGYATSAGNSGGALLPRERYKNYNHRERILRKLLKLKTDKSPGPDGLHPGVLKEAAAKIFLDMTFGAGGHTKMILSQAPDISVFALDRDPVAYGIAEQVSQEYHGRFRPLLGRFSELESLLVASGVATDTFDGVLIDAGCSSMQLDVPLRGFALSKDGPLDMRMDGDRYPDMPTAADVVNALDQQSLASILRIYGEERHAKKIAAAIAQARSIYPITRTQQLASIVAGALPASAMYARKDLLQRPAHVATKTFQALRIFVNDELNELYRGLRTAHKFLKPQGRLVALTFHSLEDRIVKRVFHSVDLSERPNLNARQKIRQGLRRQEEEEPCHSEQGNLNWSNIQKKVLTPDLQEVQENPRGRSAKLRAALKL
ncbi:probable methyltransferase-like protein 15 [Scyliorhinus canicula]|uniref:probable methyltransferase-like protein 15 n=1 Tax=Scyliorhinus canicula TaxID=7830 RepID=UPI0018F2C4A6|nr:probable methyltransferase-like protein 15 [Scyliorhinus canicula]